MYEIFITGGTGYIGRALIAELLARDYPVHALVRRGSEKKLPAGAVAAFGDALDADSFTSAIPSAASFVHLVGTPRPNPSKRRQFREVDLRSIEATVNASLRAGVQHLVYVSVAQPAPVMRSYIAVRQKGEALIRASGLNATILRPWYILGPGHRWPYFLVPIYALLRQLPLTRDSALRLGLVTLPQVITALVGAVETPANGIRIMGVPEISNPVSG